MVAAADCISCGEHRQGRAAPGRRPPSDPSGCYARIFTVLGLLARASPGHACAMATAMANVHGQAQAMANVHGHGHGHGHAHGLGHGYGHGLFWPIPAVRSLIDRAKNGFKSR